jgi:PHP family Zn ribbon phosphoesterase
VRLTELDRKLLLLAPTRAHSPPAERLARAYSRLGASYAINYAVKLAVRRPRPVAGAFAVSRPYLGVLAGALLGTLIAEAWPR